MVAEQFDRHIVQDSGEVNNAFNFLVSAFGGVFRTWCYIFF